MGIGLAICLAAKGGAGGAQSEIRVAHSNRRVVIRTLGTTHSKIARARIRPGAPPGRRGGLGEEAGALLLPSRTVLQNLQELVTRGGCQMIMEVHGHFWQKRYYYFNVRYHAQFVENIHYIHCNPVKAGLCAR